MKDEKGMIGCFIIMVLVILLGFAAVAYLQPNPQELCGWKNGINWGDCFTGLTN